MEKATITSCMLARQEFSYRWTGLTDGFFYSGMDCRSRVTCMADTPLDVTATHFKLSVEYFLKQQVLCLRASTRCTQPIISFLRFLSLEGIMKVWLRSAVFREGNRTLLSYNAFLQPKYIFPIKSVCGFIQTPGIKFFVERFILNVNFTAQKTMEIGQLFRWAYRRKVWLIHGPKQLLTANRWICNYLSFGSQEKVSGEKIVI